MSRIHLMTAMILLMTLVLIALIELATLARSADADPLPGGPGVTLSAPMISAVRT